ncbi:MAG: hypothetical protein JXB35_06245, partial [Anaerolineae bacterium]|nr:hypothetical protein [Anaerolineae bacterium]
LLCFLLPLGVLRRPPARVGLLGARAQHGARPWLIAASLLLALGGIVMAWLALWVIRTTPPPSLQMPGVARLVKVADVIVAGCIGGAITLLGRAIVGYAVFTGRPLPRRDFFRQWRSTVILAAGFSVVVSWTLVIRLRPIYSLMLATTLMVVFYALYSWRAADEQLRFMARLRPFLASQNLYDQLADPESVSSADAEGLLRSVCGDVVGAKSAALVPAGALSALVGQAPAYGELSSLPAMPSLLRALTSPALSVAPIDDPPGFWAVGLWGEGRLNGVLLLGEKVDGNPYTEEEIDLARAGAERILDTLAGSEIARVAMDLLRQRLSQARVLEGQGRRVLHDDVLPALHTALLYLSALEQTPEIREGVAALALAHHRISDLMRDTAPSVPHQLAEGGLIPALRGLIAGDLSGALDAVDWHIAAEARDRVAGLPSFMQEVMYFAARELIRNAARHGCGDQPRCALSLDVILEAYEGGVRLAIRDDGVGLDPHALHSSKRSGLRFHSAMLAAIGAHLSLRALPDRGAEAAITLPAACFPTNKT